jgi:3-oxoacyl-[acyl-carrier-protein] synthase II
MKARRRVVITGMGAITPLSQSVAELYESQIEGRSGVGPIEHFDANTFPTTFAAQVKPFDLSKYLPSAERWLHIGLNTRFGLVAAKEALEDAGLLNNSRIDPTTIGAYLGSGEGSHDFKHLVESCGKSVSDNGYTADPAVFFKHSRKCFNGQHEYEMEMNMTTGRIAEVYNLQGPNYTCQTACAASSQAIGEATELIRHGDAEMMLSGGAHSMIHPFGVTGFNLLTALSTRNDAPQKASRPFDLNRNGFVLGEGSGMVVLEELEHARRRGATIYAEITGYGTTADAFRVTDSCEDGRGAAAAIRNALEDSGLPHDAIGYVNAHGTSTKVNDRSETLALKNVFKERAYQIPVSSSKSMLGHLICAAGVVELIISVMTIRRGILPPTINYETPDPECDLDYIPNIAREKQVDHTLSNSFGFGGQNISLVVSRFTK